MEGRKVRRGDICYADLRPVIGCEQGGIRPVVILQNNTGNRFSPKSYNHSGSDHQPGRKASDPHPYPDIRAVSWAASGFYDLTGTGSDTGSEAAV